MAATTTGQLSSSLPGSRPANEAPLKLLGAANGNGKGDASRVLDSASLVVRQLAGIETESMLVNLANGGIVAATEGAGLLVVGLSERWKDEGPRAGAGGDREVRDRRRSSSFVEARARARSRHAQAT